MKSNKVPRQTSELISALSRNVKLLEEYCQKAFKEGNSDYYGEIAGKLRLLAIKTRKNEPLLLEIMRQLNFRLGLSFGAPQNFVSPKGYKNGDPIPLEEFLELNAIGIRLPSGEFRYLTKREFILTWAEQLGAAHEDWEMDEVMYLILNTPIFIGSLPAAAMELNIDASAILGLANEVISVIKANQKIDETSSDL